ncbi:hypothetical protein HPB49_012343 [Dermacentor silvarum]|uniref:Uncharacterized protein n=1 Tax=Dermacentor silvarum TaxID=543639 RepID=A0ACB8CEX7_DERSI|nr:hypothetical protein HPB49_012343 [Dermacentor silvarum]
MAVIRLTHLLLSLCALAGLGGLFVIRLRYINVDVNFSQFRDIAQDKDQDSDAFSDVVLVKPLPSHSTTTTGESKPDRMPNQAHERKPRLPPLPPSDCKIAFRPRDGLDISKWQSNHLTRAVKNLAVASTPKEELTEHISRITTLQLGGKEYQVCAYVACPNISSKGVATGIDIEIHRDELMANLRSPQAPILFARMLGKSTAAPITFDGLEFPRRIFFIM